MKPEDLTISAYGRGICPEPQCGRSISLTKSGKLRMHGAKTGWPPSNCRGSGKYPKES